MMYHLIIIDGSSNRPHSASLLYFHLFYARY